MLATYQRTIDQVERDLGLSRFNELTSTAGDASVIDEAFAYARTVAGGPARRDPRPVGGPTPSGRRVTLTRRERDVLGLLVQGMTNKEIAAELSLRPKTIMHYSCALYQKLEVRGRAEAIAWAYRQGAAPGTN
jgi:DNA-binding NarL/FixJ family response regulator